MTRSILFVCLGNICRSPTAEGVLRAMAQDAGLDLEIDSAGTGNWHLGDPPYGPAIAAARTRGYDLSQLRARQITGDDFRRYDLILAMDTENLAATEALRPAGIETRVRLLLDYAGTGFDPGLQAVPDPYFTDDFDGALDLIEIATRGLIADLLRPDGTRD